MSDGLVDNLYPVALKLATSKEYGTEEEPNSKPVNDVTTDYFNLRVKGIFLFRVVLVYLTDKLMSLALECHK